MPHEDRISALLKESGIIKGDIHFSPVAAGFSCAVKLFCNNQYFIKYANTSTIDSEGMNQCRNEYAFYEKYAGKLDFLPEVVYQTANDNEVLLVLKKYETIPPHRWDKALLQQAVEICTRINALDCTAYSAFSWLETENEPGRYSLQESCDNWMRLHKKFPDNIDAKVLDNMHNDFYKIAKYSEELTIPNTFCHGDFAPDQLLLDGARLLVCDWAYTHYGKGIGAVAYFCVRGIDQKLPIDRDALIAYYSEALHNHTGISVAPELLVQYVNVSEWLVAFRYYAEYLQDADRSRAIGSYKDMVETYMALQHKAHW